METFVLIPKELSLVISDRATSTTTTDSTTSGDRPPTKEVTAAVWSNSRISRGTRFLPFQGTVRLDKLEVFGTLDQKDVSVFHFLLRVLFFFSLVHHPAVRSIAGAMTRARGFSRRLYTVASQSALPSCSFHPDA